jgi:hypothetical protein
VKRQDEALSTQERAIRPAPEAVDQAAFVDGGSWSESSGAADI